MREKIREIINQIPILKDQSDWMLSVLFSLLGIALIIYSIRRHIFKS